MAKAIDSAGATERLKRLPGWGLKSDHIEKTYKFKDFGETMRFVNAVAWVAEKMNHHPDLEVGYGKCTVKYSTHDVGGLSENDFTAAEQVSALLA